MRNIFVSFLFVLIIFSCSNNNCKHVQIDVNQINKFQPLDLIILDYVIDCLNTKSSQSKSVFVCKNVYSNEVIKVINTCSNYHYNKGQRVSLFKCNIPNKQKILVTTNTKIENKYKNLPIYLAELLLLTTD